MEDYKRMVSYLYRYHQGKREENVGYVKMDARQGQLKIYINMKDAEAKEKIPHEIYFYYHKGKKMLGVEVGTIEFVSKEAKFRDTTEVNNICNSKKPLDDMGGMIIYLSSDLAYGTEWDDIPIKMEHFEGKAAKELTAAVEETVVVPDLVVAEEALPEIKEPELQPEELVQPLEAPREEESDVAELSEKADLIEEVQVAETDNRLDTPLTAMETILTEYEGIVHTGNNQILRCVRIQPHDLGKLDISNWRYGNNSFLIHGYYNYHYIVLCKIVSETGQQKYVIGVPGIYGNQEKYMASQFGFRDFLPTKPSDIKTGTFGYWTAELV